jgi:hypothetical protein
MNVRTLMVLYCSDSYRKRLLHPISTGPLRKLRDFAANRTRRTAYTYINEHDKGKVAQLQV